MSPPPHHLQRHPVPPETPNYQFSPLRLKMALIVKQSKQLPGPLEKYIDIDHRSSSSPYYRTQGRAGEAKKYLAANPRGTSPPNGPIRETAG
jgi:hypothetical protein